MATLAADPQARHEGAIDAGLAGFFAELEYPVVGVARYPGRPVCFSGFGRHRRRTPAPMLGRHNAEALVREEAKARA